MVYKLNESLFDDLSNPVFKDRYNDGLDWYRITYEYSPESGNSYDRETWVRAKNIKDAEQKFFEKHNDDCYISEIMDKETALGIDYEMEDISRSSKNKYSYSRFENLADNLEELLGDISSNPEFLDNFLGEDELAQLADATDILRDTAQYLATK